MAKTIIPYDRYLKIVHESESIKDMVKTDGWKIMEAELIEESNEIQEILSEKRIRNHEETIYSKEGRKKETFISLAQDEENKLAGRYLEIKNIFDMVRTIMEAPEDLLQKEQKKVLIINKADKKTKVDYSIFYPDKIPQSIKIILAKIKEAMTS